MYQEIPDGPKRMRDDHNNGLTYGNEFRATAGLLAQWYNAATFLNTRCGVTEAITIADAFKWA